MELGYIDLFGLSQGLSTKPAIYYNGYSSLYLLSSALTIGIL
jgi:hypothetical protein